MVGANVNISLFEFQENAVLDLIELTNGKRKQVVLVKSPTGSGKTIILINYIDEYLNNINKNTAFIWLCPGKGDLEEQSRQKMKKFAPNRITKTLSDALQSGFTAESTTFINWELVIKSDNKSTADCERKNLYDRIAEAHRLNIDFIIIIDEEHSNNTLKAKDIIDSFFAKNIIRMSATIIEDKKSEYLEIDETDVINAGLITKALYVNECIKNNEEISNDYDRLLDLADIKRKDIAARYAQKGKLVRPLVLIQFPNGQPSTIQAVEEKLSSMGYTYKNGMVSKWMSGDKRDIPDNLTENNAMPVFLLMKQAISTGWDCPRAKILVKLREGMNEQFEIQTIGRIRRMPEAQHYEDDLLDFCYVYTYDETWKNGLLSNLDRAYEQRKLFLKEKCKTFTLEKQIRDLDFSILGEREILNKIYSHITKKYHLSNDKNQNKVILQNEGYVIGNVLKGETIKGKYVKTEATANINVEHISTKRLIDTHIHRIYLLHCTDELKKVVGLTTAKTKAILERLFRKNSSQNKKICNFDTDEFYAFIINNITKLKEDFNEITTEITKQPGMNIFSKTATFHIPEQDLLKYDPNVKKEINFLTNAYENYTSGFNTSIVRSNCEQLFEQYCEKKTDIDWVYKNGDTGQKYFSIVYIDGIHKQWLFYADYIVKKKDGSVWIIETKGGEHKGKNKNIDKQIGNKFNAFKDYAKNKGINWGFVRDLDNQLYINNTEFTIDLNSNCWQSLEDIF